MSNSVNYEALRELDYRTLHTDTDAKKWKHDLFGALNLSKRDFDDYRRLLCLFRENTWLRLCAADHMVSDWLGGDERRAHVKFGNKVERAWHELLEDLAALPKK